VDPFCHFVLTAVNTTTNVIIDGEFVPFEDLGRRLREWRMAKGVRRGLLTQFFRISDASLSFWELGMTRPRSELWPRIVEVLEDRADLNREAERDVASSSERPEGMPSV